MTSVPPAPAVATARPGFFARWHDGTPDAKRALVAAGLGWMLDAFDVMLYALLLTSIIADLGITRQTAGAIGSVTLLAAAAGGLFFGVVADRYGRTRADGECDHLLGVHGGVRICDHRLTARRVPDPAWHRHGRSGQAVPRSCPRRGRPSIVARRSD